MALFDQVKRLAPEPLKALVRPLLMSAANASNYQDLGNFVLEEAQVFSRMLEGLPEALSSPTLRNSIQKQKCVQHMCAAHQYLQTAFTPNYEQNLYEYYRQQQFLILLAFLSYPFRGPGCLRAHVEPFVDASSKLRVIHALDYGAGMPFGLIHLLRTNPSQVASVTMVDLDIIHAEFAEFIIRRLAPNADVTCHKLNDADRIPDLGGSEFNLIYGKDIFEHVHEPEILLRAMLSKAASSCIGYLDIRDHGEKHLQHVHPQLSHLSDITSEYGFEHQDSIGGLSMYTKN